MQKGLVEWLKVDIGPEFKPQYQEEKKKKRLPLVLRIELGILPIEPCPLSFCFSDRVLHFCQEWP
jgi:hypothetical protein